MDSPKRSTPKISIITRTKNRNLLLRRALESVDKQTFHDYEHIIINDGGDVRELEDLISANKNRRLINNDKGRGLVGALNQGVKSSKGEFITILDDDDSWPEDRLQKTVDFIKEKNAKAVAAKMNLVTEKIVDGKIIHLSTVLHPESGEGQISLYKQCRKNYLSNGIITYSRKVFDELGGYDEDIATAEDWDFGIRLLLKYDVPFMQNYEALCNYHQRHEESNELGNSGLAGVSTQEETINKIKNKYLRQDLKTGKLGVGYIMNNLEYENQLVERLEGHINFTTSKALKLINSDVGNIFKDTLHERTLKGRVAKKLRQNK